jgi:hypothetical protein
VRNVFAGFPGTFVLYWYLEMTGLWMNELFVGLLYSIFSNIPIDYSHRSLSLFCIFCHLAIY